MDIEVNHRIKHNLWTLQVTGKASERKPCLDFVFSWETPRLSQNEKQLPLYQKV